MKHGCPPKSQAGSRGTSAFSELPNHFEPKLNVSGCGCQGVHFSVGRYSSGLVKNPGAVVWPRRYKVRAIQNVEDLRPELNVERLRNAMDRIILGRGEIQVYKLGAVNGIATGIAQ